MSSPVKLYQNEMHDNLGFFATWLPGDRIKLGEAGLLEDGHFRKQSSLDELDIRYEVSPKGPPQTLQYTSTAGTKVNLSGAGNTRAPILQAEITVEFSKEGSFLFHALGVRHVRIENRGVVASSIISAYQHGKWKKEWYLIEALHIAEYATIIVSQDQSAGLVFSASSDVPLGTIPLADPKVTLTVSSMRGKLVHVVGGRDISPLYSCLRLKEPLFQPLAIIPVRGDVQQRENESIANFTRPSINDLLDS